MRDDNVDISEFSYKVSDFKGINIFRDMYRSNILVSKNELLGLLHHDTNDPSVIIEVIEPNL